MRLRINSLKRLKTLVFSLAAVAVLMGAGLGASYTAGGNGNEVLAGNGTSEADALPVTGSVENAKALFDNRVTDFNDTASIVKLLDLMMLEPAIGEFTVQIYNRDGLDIMRINIETSVKKSDKDVFDNALEIYAQQLMALVEGIDEVEWTCPVCSDGSPEETVTVSVSAADASEKLGTDVKSFGTSSSEFHKLLMKQAGS